MKVHHRNYPYRPPRRIHDRKSGSFSLYKWFFTRYLTPRKWSIFICIILTGINACAVYLMAYYGRIVIDEILVVQTEPSQKMQTINPEQSSVNKHLNEKANLPKMGGQKKLDLGLQTPDRPPGAAGKLMTIFILYVGTLLTLNTLARMAQKTQIDVGRGLTEKLREDMHEQIMKLSLAYHQGNTPGRLMARIISDVEVIQQQMMNTILGTSKSLLMIIVGFIILFVADWRLALIALVVMPLYGGIYRRFKTKIRSFNRELRHTNSCMYGLATQKLDGVKAIQAYVREGKERLNFNRLAACFLRDALYQQRYGAGMRRGAEIVSSMGTSLVFIVGTHLVLKQDMSLGQMLFVYGTTATLFMPVIQLTQISVVFNNLLVVLQRVSEVLNEPIKIADAPDSVKFPESVEKGVDLCNVSFKYDEEQNLDSVVDKVKLHIPAGKWLCVMGASGAGKTTLLYLLARLYEPSSGTIYVDGIPLKKFKIQSLRQKVGFVPQEAQIFTGTVRDNICYGVPDATPTQIMAAAKAAELHDFIMQMPVYYETLIGEKGMSLSGGQRQRLSLARALLTSPEILLLDDCTSALDADTERKIQNTLTRIMLGKTAVIVSQRVSMAKRCHNIFTLENGRIAELGTHKELLQKGGFYSRLHAQQTA